MFKGLTIQSEWSKPCRINSHPCSLGAIWCLLKDCTAASPLPWVPSAWCPWEYSAALDVLVGGDLRDFFKASFTYRLHTIACIFYQVRYVNTLVCSQGMAHWSTWRGTAVIASPLLDRPTRVCMRIPLPRSLHTCTHGHMYAWQTSSLRETLLNKSLLPPTINEL